MILWTIKRAIILVFFISYNEYNLLWRKGLTQSILQCPWPVPTSSEDASLIETQQNKVAPGSLTTNFQHSEEEIIREQSETQGLHACKLSMVVDLADVLSNIKPRKEFGYDE